MWKFLTSIVNNVFGLIGLIIISPILLLLFIIALPFIAIAACVDICVNDKNTPSFSPSTIDNLSLKLNNIEAALFQNTDLKSSQKPIASLIDQPQIQPVFSM